MEDYKQKYHSLVKLIVLMADTKQKYLSTKDKAVLRQYYALEKRLADMVTPVDDKKAFNEFLSR